MTAQTGEMTPEETLTRLHPQLIMALLTPDLRENQEEQISTWPFGSRASAKVLGVITDENKLTKYGNAVIETLNAEETRFAKLQTTMSGEAQACLNDPDIFTMSERITALNPAVRLELVVNDILDEATYKRTLLGLRFLWFHRRNSTS
ncbi:MAG: hypothetical protein WBP12_02625 [Candidatus Saccharimonas sp.]